MNWLKPYSDFRLAAMGSEIQVVSVDIFDTLLLRSTMPEYTKFRTFSKEIVRKIDFSLSGIIDNPTLLTKLRLLAAKMVYHQKPPIEGGREAKLNEIYNVMLFALKLQFGLSNQQLDTISKLYYEIEILCEKMDLSVNNMLVKSLKESKNKGKKIVAISDMYLSRDSICELLASKGLDGLFDDVFVSSEFGFGKASGALYDKVLSLLEVEPKAMCHIGDNYRSDYLQAISREINAFYSPRSLVWQKVANLRTWVDYKILYRSSLL